MNFDELLNIYSDQEDADEDSAYFLLEADSCACCICDCLCNSVYAILGGFASACACC